MACGLPYHDEHGNVQDCEPEALCRRCLLGVVREQAARLESLGNAPVWSKYSERCGVAAALGVSGERRDLDAMVYAVVMELQEMRGGHAMMSVELYDLMKKWPHGRTRRV